jgi:hypothetical protein
MCEGRGGGVSAGGGSAQTEEWVEYSDGKASVHGHPMERMHEGRGGGLCATLKCHENVQHRVEMKKKERDEEMTR